MEHLVDARGLLCPKPLILAKKALGIASHGDTLKILIDNETSKTNVSRFLSDNAMAPLVAEENGLFTLATTVKKGPLPRPDAESYCTSAAQKPHVVLVSGNTIGKGSDELGAVLAKGFINTIKEVSPLPQAVILINSGVLLACEGSSLVEPLKELEAKGVRVLCCGTCVDYFNKKSGLRAGTISNAYDILTLLSNAGHVVPL